MGVLSLFILDRGRAFVAEDVPTAAALADCAALALENARLYQEAREANRGRDDVLKMVSHDLRNSLNAIGFIATELARQGGSPLATQIRSAATLADRLLSDLGALLVGVESGVAGAGAGHGAGRFDDQGGRRSVSADGRRARDRAAGDARSRPG